MRALILALLPVAAIGAEPVTCPPELPAGSVAVHAPAGWSVFPPDRVTLTGAGMMAGPPESMTDLAPTKADRTVVTWTFTDRGEKWLTCSYGSRDVRISKRLDDAVTECRVHYVKSKFGSGIERVTVACIKPKSTHQ